MATVEVQPILLKGATLIVAEDDFTAAVTQVVFTPQVLWEWEAGLGQATATPYPTGIRWTVTVGYVQDWITPGSLSHYLLTHVGDPRSVTFAPSRDQDSTAVQATVMLMPGQFGGVPNQQLTAITTMPIDGEPTLGRWEEMVPDA